MKVARRRSAWRRAVWPGRVGSRMTTSDRQSELAPVTQLPDPREPARRHNLPERRVDDVGARRAAEVRGVHQVQDLESNLRAATAAERHIFADHGVDVREK